LEPSSRTTISPQIHLTKLILVIGSGNYRFQIIIVVICYVKERRNFGNEEAKGIGWKERRGRIYFKRDCVEEDGGLSRKISGLLVLFKLRLKSWK